MALTISKKLPTENLHGLKLRLMTIVFDAAYVNGTGYAITAANCGLRNILSCGGVNLPGYQIAAIVNSDGTMTLKAYKGNTEASNNEAGLENLVGKFQVWGN
jgi:hypothetical protein